MPDNPDSISDSSWEVYSRPLPARSQPLATVPTKRNSFLLNPAARREFGLKPGPLELLVDRTAMQIGISPSEPSVTAHQLTGTGCVSCTAMLSELRVKPGKYAIQEVSIGGRKLAVFTYKSDGDPITRSDLKGDRR